MVESIVTFVLEKITDAAVKEALQIWGLEKQVERVRRELNWIKAFLKDADRKQIIDEMQKKWVREIAYSIEDVIDTFLCTAPQKKPGMGGAIKRMIGGEPKIIHNIRVDIKSILERLDEISIMRKRYGINSLGDGGGPKRLPVKPPVLPDIEDPDVIGLDADKDNIVKELLRDITRRSIVSIVGQGGLGKTTLAKKVYNSNEVGRAFDIQIWVAVSEEFELINVLRKIREKLQQIHQSELGKDEEYFLTDLFRSLKGNKYLLVFYDVWSIDLWMAIEKALPNERNGSRILMTTRIYEVSKEADPVSEPYKLSFLSEESSLELLLQNESSNGQLLDLAKKFVIKCGGLLLALVVLGGLLAKKQRTYSAWSKLLETLNWHANEQERCTKIVSTSYDDLPLALKSCLCTLLHFSKIMKLMPSHYFECGLRRNSYPKKRIEHWRIRLNVF